MRIFTIVVFIININNLIHAQVMLESSNLPIVIINTSGQTIPNSIKITADMGIIYNGPGERNYVTDSLNNYNGKIGIELRGSSSQQFPKKQYAVETRDSAGENLNVSLLELPAENDWILYAPYSDKSLIRNVVLYHLSNKIGRYASRTRFCELILNGDYRGVYVLLEKIKRDNNRVNISRLDSTDVAGDDLTGGYIIKIDKRDGEEVDGWNSPYHPTASNLYKIFYQYHYPRPDDIAPEQMTYIEQFINDFEAMMFDWSYDNPATGYRNWIDISSFVDFFLLNEISKNVDGYRLSTYYYKDKDSDDPLLHIGPVWDFNLAFGNANYYDGWDTADWQVEINRLTDFQYDYAKIPFYWERLVNDPFFLSQVVNRWSELRLTTFNNDSIIAYINETVSLLNESQQRNFERWPILDEYVWPNYAVNMTYENEISWLKNWIKQRIDWIDLILRDTIPPSAISNLDVTSISNGSFTIDWDAGFDNFKICGYDIFVDGEKVKYSILSSAKVEDLTETREYQIEVKARDYAGNYSEGNPVVSAYVTHLDSQTHRLPDKIQLYQNYPNPFNSFTTISYYLFENTDVTIQVFNTIGQDLLKLIYVNQSVGKHKFIWDGKDKYGNDLSSGVYIYQIKSRQFKLSRKMILLR
ncbi:MAG: CotH kinase family protein [Calditrichaceae bacterium]|nr:CotH kinase family protein [Calditrichaceae bacterium]